MSDTIFALSSGLGPAGVAVIRVSGPRAGRALGEMTGRDLPPPRRASRVAFSNPATGEALDDGLALWFPGPASVTGEDVAEIHIHGGRAVIAAVIDALAAQPGLRAAEPGEFTRRAFENGKLDLTAAEGLADLVNAETEAQRRQARRQLEGELGRLYEAWRERLLSTLAHFEADLDFPDEDLPGGIAERLHHNILGLIDEISQHLDDNRRGERLREGFYIAIIGPPNVGKSSLLNRLARRDAAIVSATAGTTRDVIEVHLDLAGYPVILADTAGLREGAEAIEGEGVRRARARAANADLKLVLLDASAWPEVDPTVDDLVDADSVVIINKADLSTPAPPLRVAERPALPVSVLTGEGLDGLLKALEREVAARLADSGAVALTRVRHRAALEACVAALRRSLTGALPELAAEDVRLAARSLGRITGRVDVEDVLDVIFRDFCIGK